MCNFGGSFFLSGPSASLWMMSTIFLILKTTIVSMSLEKFIVATERTKMVKMVTLKVLNASLVYSVLC